MQQDIHASTHRFTNRQRVQKGKTFCKKDAGQAADADQDISTDAIVATLKSRIKWEDLSIAQQAALGGVLIAVENDLRDRRRSDALVNVRRLLDVITAAAESET